MSRLINIQFRRGQASQWIESNPVLGSGELGFELDTNQFKIGNGISNWLSLPYQSINKYLIKKQTTNNSQDVVLTADGLEPASNGENLVIVPSQTTWLFTINLSAYNITDHTRAAFSFRGAVGRNNANQTSLIGEIISESFLDENMSSVSAKIEADDETDSLKVKVTGLSNKTINWNGSIIINEVSEA